MDEWRERVERGMAMGMGDRESGCWVCAMHGTDIRGKPIDCTDRIAPFVESNYFQSLQCMIHSS